MFRSRPNACLIALTCVSFASCDRGGPEDPSANQQNQSAAPAQSAPIPLAEAPLGREALLLAIAKSASAQAIGQGDLGQQRALDGKPFELRIRFGCASGDMGGETFRFSVDEEPPRVRLSAAPDIALENETLQRIVKGEFEAAEGFWIAQPWLLAPACPPADTNPAATDPEAGNGTEPEAAPPPVAPSAPRIGLAQFFAASESRTQRRGGRSYQATESLAEGQAPSPQGYDLVLGGRLKALPDGRVIACNAASPASPPDCIVSVEFGRVRIERPGADAPLAQWGDG
jgi:hypothetical protein